MVDWADDWADRIIEESDPELYPHSIRDRIAAALRQAKAEARQAENEKCRELIEKRVGDTRYQGA